MESDTNTGIPLWAILFYGVYDVLYLIVLVFCIVRIVRARKAQHADPKN